MENPAVVPEGSSQLTEPTSSEGIDSCSPEAMGEVGCLAALVISDEPGIMGMEGSVEVKLVTIEDVNLDATEMPGKEEIDSRPIELACTVVTTVLGEECVALVSAVAPKVLLLLGAELLLGAGLMPNASVVSSSAEDSGDVMGGEWEGPRSDNVGEAAEAELMAGRGVREEVETLFPTGRLLIPDIV